jgi:hypothetical protein
MAQLKEPITVAAIEWGDGIDQPCKPELLFGGKAGDWVAIRPCIEGIDTKTYLGVLLGEMHAPSVQYNKETSTLTIGLGFMGNPAIWVPDLNRIVMGYESWLGKIDSPDDLRQITDADIENVWYVQCLKALAKKTPPSEGGDAT